MISHLEFLTEPVLRELRSQYEEGMTVWVSGRRFNEYRRLLREVNAELFVRTRDEIARKHR